MQRIKGMNIYQRKDGRWEGRIKQENASDKKYLSVYGKTYEEAFQKLLDKKKMIEREKEETNITVESAAKIWLNEKEKTLKESSIAQYNCNIKKYIIPQFSNRKISNITLEEIMKFSDTLVKKGLNPKTAHSIAQILTSIIKFGESKKFVKSEKKCKEAIDIMSEKEWKKLIRILKKDMDNSKLGVLCIMYTGIRIGELCALCWKDINFENNEITINKDVQRLQKSRNEGSKTKLIISDVKQRKIPIASKLLDILVQYKGDDDAYILSGTDKIIDARTMQYRLNGYAKKGKISNVEFSKLRSTFLVRALEVGVDIRFLSEILGINMESLIKYISYTKNSLDKFLEIQKINKL